MPFKSKAQQRFMFSAESRGEVPKGTAKEWADSTPSIKKLPEKVREKGAGILEKDATSRYMAEMEKVLPDSAASARAQRAILHDAQASIAAGPGSDYASSPAAIGRRKAIDAGIGKGHDVLKQQHAWEEARAKAPIDYRHGVMSDTRGQSGSYDLHNHINERAPGEFSRAQLPSRNRERLLSYADDVKGYAEHNAPRRAARAQEKAERAAFDAAMASEANKPFNRFVRSVGEHPVRAGLIGAGTLGALGLGAYGLHRAFGDDKEPKVAKAIEPATNATMSTELKKLDGRKLFSTHVREMQGTTTSELPHPKTAAEKKRKKGVLAPTNNAGPELPEFKPIDPPKPKAPSLSKVAGIDFTGIGRLFPEVVEESMKYMARRRNKKDDKSTVRAPKQVKTSAEEPEYEDTNGHPILRTAGGAALGGIAGALGGSLLGGVGAAAAQHFLPNTRLGDRIVDVFEKIPGIGFMTNMPAEAITSPIQRRLRHAAEMGMGAGNITGNVLGTLGGGIAGYNAGPDKEASLQQHIADTHPRNTQGLLKSAVTKIDPPLAQGAVSEAFKIQDATNNKYYSQTVPMVSPLPDPKSIDANTPASNEGAKVAGTYTQDYYTNTNADQARDISVPIGMTLGGIGGAMITPKHPFIGGIVGSGIGGISGGVLGDWIGRLIGDYQYRKGMVNIATNPDWAPEIMQRELPAYQPANRMNHSQMPQQQQAPQLSPEQLQQIHAMLAQAQPQEPKQASEKNALNRTMKYLQQTDPELAGDFRTQRAFANTPREMQTMDTIPGAHPQQQTMRMAGREGPTSNPIRQEQYTRRLNSAVLGTPEKIRARNYPGMDARGNARLAPTLSPRGNQLHNLMTDRSTKLSPMQPGRFESYARAGILPKPSSVWTPKKLPGLGANLPLPTGTGRWVPPKLPSSMFQKAVGMAKTIIPRIL